MTALTFHQVQGSEVWELRGYGFSAAQITAEVRKVALEREAVAA